MRKENILLLLWIIFGFVFILAVDSILYLIIHLIYFGLAELGISYKIMTFIIPFITLILYILTTYAIIKRLKLKLKTSVIYLTEFPKRLIVILAIIIVILTPLTTKLTGLYEENISVNTLLEQGEYLIFYGWLNLGFAISQSLILIALVVISLKKLNNQDIN